MKTLLTATAAVVLLSVSANSALACYGYGLVDTTVLVAVGDDAAKASAAYGTLLRQGKNGLRRAQRTRRSLQFEIRMATHSRNHYLNRDMSKLSIKDQLNVLKQITNSQRQLVRLQARLAKTEKLIKQLTASLESNSRLATK